MVPGATLSTYMAPVSNPHFHLEVSVCIVPILRTKKKALNTSHKSELGLNAGQLPLGLNALLDLPSPGP
jgi:hypothetical protein